jgi:hypothetical protein
VKSRLPTPDEIAALLPEELAPYMLEDLAQIVPNSMDRGRLNIGNYCNSFDGDIHGPMRSHQAREQTRQSLAEAWSLLERLGFIAPETNQGNYGWFFVTRRGREAAQSREAFERGRKAAQFSATMLHEELRGAAYDALVRGNFQQAVAEAFRVVEVKVRNAAGVEGVGATLMRAAFHEDTGPLVRCPGSRRAASATASLCRRLRLGAKPRLPSGCPDGRRHSRHRAAHAREPVAAHRR